MNIEKAFEIVGTCGRFQSFLVFLLFVTYFFVATQMVLMIIVGATPNMNQTDEVHLQTIETEWNLHDKQWVVELMQSLFMGGFAIGCVSFGQLADFYGRRIVLVPCLACSAVCAMLSGGTSSWQLFAVTRFFTGVFIGGIMSGYTLMLEYIGRDAWQVAGMVFQMFFSLGMMFLALLGYLVLEWRAICLITGTPLLILFPIFLLILPESPRWLYSVGRIRDAETVMRKLAKKNGRDPSKIILGISDTSMIEEKKNTLIDIFRHRKLTIWFFSNSTVWFCCSLVYYGLTMSVGDLNESIYLSILLSAAVEIPGSLVCIYFMGGRMGRKGTIIATFIIGFLACIGMTLQPDGSAAWKLAFGLTAKLAISAAFNILYVYSVEIFPTSLRTVALGAASTLGRFGAIIAPFVVLLSSVLPYVVFAIICGIACLSTLILPATNGYLIPHNIEESLFRKKYNDETVYRTERNESFLELENANDEVVRASGGSSLK